MILRKTSNAWLMLILQKKFNFIYLKELRLEGPSLRLKIIGGTKVDR
jgi:hypothetical protein